MESRVSSNTVAGGFFVANNYHERDPRTIALLQDLMTQSSGVR